MAYRLGFCDEEDGYRYSLLVETDAKRDRDLVVVQCNPSLASGTRSDPTVGKVSTWAEESGFGTITFLNLFAKRSASVHEISGLPYGQLVGPRNDVTLQNCCNSVCTLVFAWGSLLPVPVHLYEKRLLEIREIFSASSIFRVGALVAGRFPRHGRMWNSGQRSLHPLGWQELIASKNLLSSDSDR